jgi:hypothetical protein
MARNATPVPPDGGFAEATPAPPHEHRPTIGHQVQARSRGPCGRCSKPVARPKRSRRHSKTGERLSGGPIPTGVRGGRRRERPHTAVSSAHARARGGSSRDRSEGDRGPPGGPPQRRRSRKSPGSVIPARVFSAAISRAFHRAVRRTLRSSEPPVAGSFELSLMSVVFSFVCQPLEYDYQVRYHLRWKACSSRSTRPPSEGSPTKWRPRPCAPCSLLHHRSIGVESLHDRVFVFGRQL